MKKIKLLMLAAMAGSTLFLTSCSNQMYGYRQKVKVDQSIAKADKQNAPKEIESKAPVAPEVAMNAPEALTPSSNLPKSLAEPQVKVPSSKAFSQSVMVKEFKSAKQALKKEVKALKSKIEPKKEAGININGIQWMIIGAILMLAGWILAALIGGTIFSIIGTIGSVIFIVGLIFWLVDVLG